MRAADPSTRPVGGQGRLGVGSAFFGMFLALADSRFDGESTLPPQVPLKGHTHRVLRKREPLGETN
jgi:hypothetical protein